jgi:hypothetical protein
VDPVPDPLLLRKSSSAGNGQKLVTVNVLCGWLTSLSIIPKLGGLFTAYTHYY